MSESFEILSPELTEEILKRLAVPDLLRASLTCRFFLSLISSPTFPSSSTPWFFLCGLHNISSKNHQTFAFDPASFSWFRLPPPSSDLTDVSVSNGFYLSTSSSSSSFSPVFRSQWSTIPPLISPRRTPLTTVFSRSRIVVLTGAQFFGGLVDIDDRLAVEEFDESTRSWTQFPPLPVDFPFGYSSQTLSSVIHRDKLFVFGIYTFSFSWFDLETRNWSPVLTLRPPRAFFSFMISCGELLVVASMCSHPNRFVLWKVDGNPAQLEEIATMPNEMIEFLVDSEQDESKFASLKCVGTGNLVYVFNEDHYKAYAACVYDIVSKQWRKVPPLPAFVNKFHKVICFCSDVSLEDIFKFRK